MAYTKTNWVDNTTLVDATRMNNIENGVAANDTAITANAARLLPTPVVNGQWVKGVGGAAVWAPLTPADLDAAMPSRLATAPSGMTTDLNTATENGWYAFDYAAANRPFNDYGMMEVLWLPPNHNRQTVYRYNTDEVWTRRKTSGTWEAWVQTRPP